LVYKLYGLTDEEIKIVEGNAVGEVRSWLKVAFNGV